MATPSTRKGLLQNYRKFVQFTKSKYGSYRHPKDLTKHDVADFLTHLAADKNLAADTQRVALSSIKFLYDQVLGLDIGITNFMRFDETEKASCGDELQGNRSDAGTVSWAA